MGNAPAAPARDDLRRSYAFTIRAVDDPARADGDDGLTLDGYGAVFNELTEINSWEGAFFERVAPGAFRKSLRERIPRLQFDHGSHPLIGSIPIGRITDIGEDDHGLHVVARLSDNWLVEPVRDAIRDESVDGMSFRFSVIRDEWVDAAGKRVQPAELNEVLWNPGDRGPLTRTLKEVKISEVGPVVWPAYEGTSVGVRSKVTIDLGRLRDPDQRSILARAVLLADAAESTDEPPTTTDPDDAPPVTAPAADEHAEPSTTTDAPRATDGPPSAGEHMSASPKLLKRDINDTAAAYRDYLSAVLRPTKENPS